MRRRIETNPDLIGNLFTEARHMLGMTQRQVCDHAGIKATQELSAIEAGRRIPDWEKAATIAQAMGYYLVVALAPIQEDDEDADC